MAKQLDDRILDLVAVKLLTITLGAGYNQTVTNVYGASGKPVPSQIAPADCPAVQIRRLPKPTRFHIRGAEEFVLNLDLVCVVSAAIPDHDKAIHELVNDVKKLVYANLLWNDGAANLAVKSWVVEDDVHEAEVDERTRTGVVVVAIKARADRANLANPKAV